MNPGSSRKKLLVVVFPRINKAPSSCQSVKFKHFLCADALCKSSINLLTNQLNIVSVWMDKIERIYSPCVRRDAP